ncbi:hypothetical protein SNEBB_003468 [Seison nebaliae]|nr:hypothetical protein SNEBB_003468 [Seison nebaliae]
MSCFNNFKSSPKNSIDGSMYPYLSFYEKLDQMKPIESSDECMNIPVRSSTTVGAHFTISTLVLLQSVPYFMLMIYDDHKNDDWDNIRRYSEYLLSFPESTIDIIQGSAGEYLVMELLRSYGVNPGDCKLKTKNFRKNFVDHFLYLTTSTSFPLRKSRPFSFMTSLYIVTKSPRVSNTNVRDKLIYAYKTRELNVSLVTHIDLILSRTTWDYERSEKFEDNGNFLTIHPRLNYWSIQLNFPMISPTSELLNYRPFSPIINTQNWLKYFSRETKNKLLLIARNSPPNWALISVERLPFQQKEPHRQIRIIHPTFYLQLYELLSKSIVEDEMHRQLINLHLPIGKTPIIRNLTTPLIDTPFFDELLEEITTDNQYDTTGFIFGHLTPISRINASQPDHQSFREDFNNQINMCIEWNMNETYNFFSEMPLAKYRIKARENYVKFKSDIRTMIRLFCLHTLYYVKSPEIQTRIKYQTVVLVRTLNGKNWYHIYNTNVSPISDIREMLYAYRRESFLGTMLSNRKQHAETTNKWNLILRNALPANIQITTNNRPMAQLQKPKLRRHKSCDW